MECRTKCIGNNSVIVQDADMMQVMLSYSYSPCIRITGDTGSL